MRSHGPQHTLKSSSEPKHVATTSWHEQAGSLSRHHRADRVRFTAAHVRTLT
ncbi:hypothetical protein SEA_ARLO_86 [Mycobacterium phage Arlo]|nr:hypothetical protein SEA_ARLO_86 [Mycobacterium phage Arlo]